MNQTANRPDGRVELRLREAIIRWCDQDLIKQIRREELAFTLAERRKFRLPSIALEEPPETGLTDIRPYVQQVVVPNLHRLWSCAVDDLKERLKARQLFMRAILITKLVPAEPISIPVAWVPLLKVLVFDEIVGMADRPYGDVLVSDQPWPDQQSRNPDALPHPVDAVAPANKDNGAAERKIAKRGGRPNACPIIEAALREHWRTLFPNRPPQHRPVWTELARSLEKRMKQSGGGVVSVYIPSHETIRKHLPLIYGRVLGETAPIDQSPKRSPDHQDLPKS